MEKIWKDVLIGGIVAGGGLFFSDMIGGLFNGMDYGSACVLGISLYLCVVVITCTGVIVTKLDKNSGSNKLYDDTKSK